MKIILNENQFKSLMENEVKETLLEGHTFNFPIDNILKKKAFWLGRKFYLYDFNKDKDSFYFTYMKRNFSVRLDYRGHVVEIMDMAESKFADKDFVEKFDDIFQKGFEYELDKND